MATKKKQKPSPKKPTRTKSPAHSFDAELAALPTEAGQQDPGIPASVALLEASRIIKPALEARPKMAKLEDFDMRHVDHLGALVTLAEQAEKAWSLVRYTKAGGTGRGKARKEGETLRAAVLAAGYYLFRKKKDALTELHRISEGDGLADLVQDLHDLKTHRTDNAATWDKDVTLPRNAFARMEEVRAILEAGEETEEAASAHEHRNRVFVLLDEYVSEIREAANYLFRGDAARLKPFRSDYEAARKRKARKNKGPV